MKKGTAYEPGRDPIPLNNKSVDMECGHCGCTQERACPGGCYWIYEGVCSQCEDKFKNDPANQQSNQKVSTLINKLTMSTASEKKEKAAEQRRHHIHFQLKKRGIVIDPEKKTVSLSDEMKAKLGKNETKWLDELKDEFGYEIQSAIHIEPNAEKVLEAAKSEEDEKGKENKMEKPEPKKADTPRVIGITGGFFSAMMKYLENAGARIIIDRNEDLLSVTILPHLKKDGTPFRITPFNARGTAAEMDEGLMAEVDKFYEKLEEKGLKTNAEDFTESIDVRPTPKAKKAEGKPAAASKAAKASSSKKAGNKAAKAKPAAAPKKTIKDQVEAALKAGKIEKAQVMVKRADKAGGMPKDKVKELQALVDAAIEASYYSKDEQAQLKTRLDSMRTETEQEETALRNLKEATTDPGKKKQFEGMMKDPIKKLQLINKAIGLLESKKLGFKGKKLIPIAQLVKNPIA